MGSNSRYRRYRSHSNSRSKVCVKYAGPMELWNDALVTPCEGQSRRRLSPLRLSANTAMLRTACFLCVIGHRELLLTLQNSTVTGNSAANFGGGIFTESGTLTLQNSTVTGNS